MQITHPQIVGHGLIQDHSIGAFGFNQIADGRHRVFVAKEGHDDDMISRAAQRLGCGIDQTRGVVHHVGFTGKHQGDDVGFARAQTQRSAVGAIAKALRNLADAAFGFFANIRRILQSPADRCHRKTRFGGNGLKRGASLLDLRGGWVCHPFHSIGQAPFFDFTRPQAGATIRAPLVAPCSIKRRPFGYHRD